MIISLILSTLMTAAHFLRGNDWFLTASVLIFPFILFYRRQWTYDLVVTGLAAAAVVWISSALEIYGIRKLTGQPYVRMFVILLGVTAFTLFTAWLVYRKRPVPDSAAVKTKADGASYVVFVIVFIMLEFVRQKVTAYPMLLADRFYPGAGHMEILLLSLYGALVMERFADPDLARSLRLKIWKIFSIVFFAQLILGFTVSSVYLMTGKLHIPVPSIILLGPIYRGEGFFMPLLFLSTVVLVGPAWCSYLCYFGAWDGAAAVREKKPEVITKWAEPVRISLLVIMVAATLLLRALNVPGIYAAAGGLVIGAAGIAVMVFLSRRLGTMVHCRAYCPIGLLAVLLGRLNPVRIRINDSCTDCNACRISCRYDALNIENIRNRKAGYTCTLCGDCISSCHVSALEYKAPRLSPEHSRLLFLVLIISLHAVFMGLARI